MSTLNFIVEGVPRPQGSKTLYRGHMRESSKYVKGWREEVEWSAAAARKGPVYTGPCEVVAEFYFKRPKIHYLAGSLRDSAPVFHTAKPDIEKLLRAIHDAMTGVIYRDDSQVAIVSATKKYADRAYAVITVTEVT